MMKMERSGTICTHKEKLSQRHALNKFILVINKGRKNLYIFTRFPEKVVHKFVHTFKLLTKALLSNFTRKIHLGNDPIRVKFGKSFNTFLKKVSP